MLHSVSLPLGLLFHMLIPLSSDTTPDVSKVGGKAASLMRLTAEGYNVPPGVVVTADFFSPWFEELQATGGWQAVLSSIRSSDELSVLHEKCERLKGDAIGLPLNTAQTGVLRELSELITTATPDPTFAVRSSSPEEDLAGASFAGQYETVLGVAPDDIEHAIRKCFASSLDARVVHYKQEMGFDLTARIAIIVQQMVDSDSAGVAFSINPLTNDFDEVLINSAFGLGEELVSGEITPDSIVADKGNGRTIEYRVGTKGDIEAEKRSLSDNQIRDLVALVRRIEHGANEPMDIEWAFNEGELFVLQSRPVTTYVPLHADLQTAPDEVRHLYIDGFLTDGITMSSAISPMATSAFEVLADGLFRWLTGLKAGELSLESMGVHLSGGRMYVDFNLFATVYGRQEKFLQQAERMNPFYVAMFTSSEIDRYDKSRPPGWSTFKMIKWGLRILWSTKAAATKLISAWSKGPGFKAHYDAHVTRFERHINRELNLDEPLREGYWHDMIEGGLVTIEATFPATVLMLISQARIRGLARKDHELRLLADDICAGYEDDMVVQMGLTMHDLAMMLPRKSFDDIDLLAHKIITKRELPVTFLKAWDAFVSRFGDRGPLEMEIANDRYGDSPLLALQQLKSIAASGGSFDPHKMHTDKVARRETAFMEMAERLSGRKRRVLERCYRRSLEYSGAREYFKHHVLQMYRRLRRKLLHRAKQFVEAGRLDDISHIFDVSIDDVDNAITDHTFDLRDARAATTFQQQQRERVPSFPMFIDSRGRIPKITLSDLPDDIDENTVVGAAVSPGVSRGRIKCLLNPFDKDIEPGDVLVAVTTDPGWTPLFINAAAIVLEIGGELQHGALVAREYGKPCVSSIPQVLEQFEDGQLVEVDGDRGRVTILEQPVDMGS